MKIRKYAAGALLLSLGFGVYSPGRQNESKDNRHRHLSLTSIYIPSPDYQKLCSCCHGLSGKGNGHSIWDEKKSGYKYNGHNYHKTFLDCPVTQEKGDEELERKIREGFECKEHDVYMPAFRKLKNEQIRTLINDIREFGKRH